MNGKSMYGKKGPGSAKLPTLPDSVVERKKEYPLGTGFESDYDRVELDEQTDDYAGFPKPCP